ncbi:MAG: hypothetical protein GF331_11100 [Chitinivibrionales bacterium]|nr:hypothetical protein [Chitinivibrionales bacterium]
MALRTRPQFLLLLLLLCSLPVSGRSFVGITTWPSFRLGNDLGRFEWFLDIAWHSSVWSAEKDTLHLSSKYLEFSPSLGCNVTLYDSVFSVYVGAVVGSDFRFYNGTYSDITDLDFAAGGGLEWRLGDKVGLVGEYLLEFWVAIYPESHGYTDEYQYGFRNRPSVQLRYYIGPSE